MTEKIISIISKISKLNENEIQNSQNVKGLWDSFSHLELVLQLEEEFQIMFEPEEIAEMTTINKVISAVEEKVK